MKADVAFNPSGLGKIGFHAGDPLSNLIQQTEMQESLQEGLATSR